MSVLLFILTHISHEHPQLGETLGGPVGLTVLPSGATSALGCILRILLNMKNTRRDEEDPDQIRESGELCGGMDFLELGVPKRTGCAFGGVRAPPL